MLVWEFREALSHIVIQTILTFTCQARLRQRPLCWYKGWLVQMWSLVLWRSLQTDTWTVLLALICSWWRRSHCWLCWYCKDNGKTSCLLSICGPEARVWIWGCDHVPGQILVVTFSMLLWCFCSLSRSVGRATLMNLWIGASRRLSVSLLPSSAMCPADCPQPTPLCNLDSAPAQLYLTAPTDTVNTSRVWF